MNTDKVFLYSKYEKKKLVSPYIKIPNDIDSFYFDTCKITENFILKNVAGYIFKIAMSIVNYKLNETKLTNFINLVCENYNNNPFHNFQHAVNILHICFLLFKKTNIINKLEPHIFISTLIAALCHDVGHPGNNNFYEINSISKLAKLYNDISVLENFHTSLTFDMIEECKLHFKGKFKECRKTIISCILATDISKHETNLDNFSKLNLTKEMLTIDEQILIASCFVHFSDLSSSIKNFKISYEWSKRISRELINQTIKEESEGLPSISSMKIQNANMMAINEIKFITEFVIPCWNIFVSKFDNMTFIIDNVYSTLSEWNKFKMQI